MAAIRIEATLDDRKINEGFENIKQKGKQTVDAIGNHAREQFKKITEAFGGSQGLSRALNQASELRKTINALSAAAEQQHQRKLVEFADRTAKAELLIAQRKAAQLDAIRARQEVAEQRHAQRLREIQERGANAGYGRLTELAQRFLTVTGAVALATKAVNEAVKLDSAVRALTAVTGGAEAAQAQLVRLREIAKLPGIDFEGAIRGATRLQAVGFTAAEAERALKAFANAVALTGGGAEQLNSITVQLGQLSSKSKVLAQDLRPIIEAAPAVGQALKRAFGTVDSEQISKQLEKAGKDSKAFIGILLTELEKLPRVTAGPKEAIENLRVSIDLAFAGAGDVILSALVPAMEQATKAADDFSTQLQRNKGDVDELKKATALFGEQAIGVFTDLGKLLDQTGINKTRLLTELINGLTTSIAIFRDVVTLLLNSVGAGVLTTVRLIAESVRALLFTVSEDLSKKLDPVVGKIAELQHSFLRGTSNALSFSNTREVVAQINANRVRVNQGLFDIDRTATPLGGQPSVPPGSRTTDGDATRARRPKITERERELERIRQFLVADEIRTLKEFVERAKDIAELEENADLKKARADFTLSANLRFGGNKLTEQQFDVLDPRILAGQRAESLFNIRDLQTRQQEVAIQNQINVGLLTEAEGRKAILAVQRESRDELIQFLEIQKQAEFAKGALGSAEAVEQLNLQIEQLKSLGTELSNSQAFAKGFNSQIESVSDAFERLGANVSRSLTNIKDLFGGLKRNVLQFFNDIIGTGLQRLLRSTLPGIFGGQQSAGSGGGGNAGIPGFDILNPRSGAVLGFSENSLLGIGTGFGIGDFGGSPSSVTAGGRVLSAANLPGLNSTSRSRLLESIFGIDPNGTRSTATVGGFAGRFLGGGAVSLLPALLGAGLGAGVGGQSGLGRILGAIGGGAVGLGLSFGASVFGALGGGFGALGPAFLAALGPAAIIGAPLLIGALLLGRAAARRRDERTSGDYLQQAVDAIKALRRDVISDRVVGESEARKIFNDEILKTFIDQINTIKTASVRNSRLTNQTRDLKALFEKEVLPVLADQSTRRAVSLKLIPEFATGGFHRGAGLAMLHDYEMILNHTQQRRVQAIAGPEVFLRAGVPGAPSSGPFEGGGVYRSGGRQDIAPVFIFENVTLALSEDDATRILGAAVRTSDGRRYITGTVNDAEIRRRG